MPNDHSPSPRPRWKAVWRRAPGYWFAEIARILDAVGYRTKRGKRLAAQTVKDIISTE